MKFLKYSLAALLTLVGVEAFAADQQVDPDTYRASGAKPFYGRSDGLFYHKSSKTPVLVGNGDGYHALGPTYIETFDYGDGLGAFCSTITSAPGDAGFVVIDGADTACDTTCGQAACVAGYDDSGGGAGTGTLEDCADAGSDFCICQNTGLDLYGVCGANWEAPAGGFTMIETSRGYKLGHFALVEQLIGPDMDAAANGLDISGDLADNNGVEVFGGMLGAQGRPMVPGTDPAFKFCASMELSDVSDEDTLFIGFREPVMPLQLGSHTAVTIDGYGTFAAIGVDNATGDIHTVTNDDGAGVTTTDITLGALADDTEFKACVYVSDARAVTYTIDGAAAADAVSFTFDAGEPVIPFIYLVHGSGGGDEVFIQDWEVSYQ